MAHASGDVAALGASVRVQLGERRLVRRVRKWRFAPDLEGEHTWTFSDREETLVLTHRAHSRQAFLRGVTGFEKDLVRHGTVLVKLYFSVTKDEQARRFDRRKTDPLRQWKLSEVDVQAQERWDDFTGVKYEMLKKTHTTHAPWTIIRSNDKHLARLNAMKVILNSVPYQRLNPDLDFVPDHEIVISGSRELELMEAQRLQEGKFLG